MEVAQSCLTVIPWTVAHQAPLSMKFSRQEYWNVLPFPSKPKVEPKSPALQVDSLSSEPPGKSIRYIEDSKFNIIFK